MNCERVKVVVRGAVQGVGFRPFVYRLATGLGLNGTVKNSAQGVFIEIEGPRPALNDFLLRLEKEKPTRAMIQSLEFSFLEIVGFAGFEICPSNNQGEKSSFILPDVSPCADCLCEISDPADRRYLYPFTNCTNCGPRFSIIKALPYDRPNTSMKKFAMCNECEREYRDPANRRFHAQPNACPDCGPQLALWDDFGNVLSERREALQAAAVAIRSGKIVALKGVGGFQLIVDARNEQAVSNLRRRKTREKKPLAVMYPRIGELREDCIVNDFEERLLASAEAPIVLLQKNGKDSRLANSVAPNNPNLGAMLPSSPLHHVLLRELGFPVVATSGNLSSEPICIDEREALKRLQGIADFFLVHDRPIVRQVDDSVARIILGRELMLRRARGYAPLPINCMRQMSPVLAVGPHLKNAIALGNGREIIISQHIGDLEMAEALLALRRVTADLQKLYEFTPETIACDLHPEYLSTKFARTLNKPVLAVQHHFAHVLACMAENELEEPVLGVSWDGTGLGPDGTIWGGEFLRVNGPNENGDSLPAFERVAHLRQFRLPGGDVAIKQPRRAALGLLWEIFGEKLFENISLFPELQFSEPELITLRQMLMNKVNVPKTSSAGRLFDGVAAFIGLRSHCSFEGQAAMDLEFAAQPGIEESYTFEILPGKPWVIDWQSMLLAIFEDMRAYTPIRIIAARFHNTLAEMIVKVAGQSGETKIVLSGGCFQNKYLLERVILMIRQAGLKPFWHQRIPTNDGGIALGQVMAASWKMNESDFSIRNDKEVDSVDFGRNQTKEHLCV